MKEAASARSKNGAAIPSRMQAGMAQLAQACCYATDVSRDVWDFAVEMASLQAAGLTKNDCRWLVCKGYVEHAHELPQPKVNKRQFRRGLELTFSERTCFVLTSAGARIVSSTSLTSVAGRSHPSRGFSELSQGSQLPRWDIDRHEFYLGNQLVKVFKVPSPNQEAILTVFQEEGWPPRIDDPLPPALGIDPKTRLHDAIKSLNRNQKVRLIRFKGDGTGEGILWETMLINQTDIGLESLVSMWKHL